MIDPKIKQLENQERPSVKTLMNRNTKLRNALEWYGENARLIAIALSHSHSGPRSMHITALDNLCKDKGQRANEALEE